MSEVFHRKSETPSRLTTVSVQHKFDPGASPDVQTFLTPGSLDSEEWLESTYGKLNKWNDCLHYKLAHAPSPPMNAANVFGQWHGNSSNYSPVTVDDWRFGFLFTTGDFGELGKFTSGLPDLLLTSEEGFTIPNPPNIDSILQSCLNATLPSIKSELSVVNSILELKDFKSLPATISNMGRFVRNGRKTLREILRHGSDAYLQQQFNIKPLLSDIQGIYNSLANTERRINDFITRQGRVRRKHYAFAFTEFEPYISHTNTAKLISYPSTTGPINFNASSTATRVVFTDPTWFHFEIEYNYNYTRFQLEHARVLAYLDAFGVNNILGIVWNALPWSFVIDWVLGVSRLLDDLDPSNMDPVVNIRKCLWSVTRRRQILVNQKFVSFPDGPTCYTSAPLVVEKAYKRRSFVPTSGSITSSGLNLKEFSLGAALVSSRRRRRTRG